MEPITEFHITCYHDIHEDILNICERIKIPHAAPKSITHVFDEEKSVKWNREQVEIYNKEISEARREAVEVRNECFRNLDKAVIDYMMEYEAKPSTPRAVIKAVVARVKSDHDDDWYNYLSDYLDFAETILEVIEEN